MRSQRDVTNIVIAGLGGQGVLTCSDILAEAVLLAGFDVKKADIHGMSQRGGSVTSDVRFGRKVFSPMITPGDADFLLLLNDCQLEITQHYLRVDGVLLREQDIAADKLPHPRTLNAALLGRLSAHLPVAEENWHEAIRRHAPAKFLDLNLEVFVLGRKKEA